jgi:exonuclease VII large subunit
VTDIDHATYTPTRFLREVARRLLTAFQGTVVVTGRVVAVRVSGGWTTLTLADEDARGRRPTRLQVSVSPRVAARTVPQALVEQTVVQVEGTVDLWIERAEVQLRAVSIVRTGHSQTQASYEAAEAAIAAERLGEVRPALPLFLRRVLLLAPHGTTLGDLTRDLGGWQPPEIRHRPIPGDSPDLHRLIGDAVRADRDVDLVVLARGGTIEAISGWDDLELLRILDRMQRAGIPVLAAIGHADHTPLVYRVCGYTVRHTAEAGRWLADHNRTAALRIAAAETELPAALGRLLDRTAGRIDTAGQQVRAELRRHLSTRDRALDAARQEVRTAVRLRLGQAETRHRTAAADLRAAMHRCLADAERRVELAAATLDGFRRGVALVTAIDGTPARFEVGERLRIEVADATATATIDTVVRHPTDDVTEDAHR